MRADGTTTSLRISGDNVVAVRFFKPGCVAAGLFLLPLEPALFVLAAGIDTILTRDSGCNAGGWVCFFV